MKSDLFKTGSCYPQLRGLYGSKLHITEHGLLLLVSYDDFSEEEIEHFCKTDIEITFKKFGLVSLLLFKFQGYLVDASFDLFETASTWKKWEESKKEPMLELVLCDYTTGEVYGTRVETLPVSFYVPWMRMLGVINELDRSKYKKELFELQRLEIYDNHTIDEIYEMSGEETRACTARVELFKKEKGGEER